MNNYVTNTEHEPEILRLQTAVATKRLKNNKAPYADGIAAVVLKAIKQTAMTLYTSCVIESGTPVFGRTSAVAHSILGYTGRVIGHFAITIE